ncbi:RtcB family protein [Candidatus Woesearchaeota archaeon]|nr:RtcB family protein [Candidatus Woesearchaeota archaeon]
MVNITSFEDTYYYPPPQLREGLDALVRFPDGEFKRNSIPNSSIWVYNPAKHRYNPGIFSGDAGCGIAAFSIDEVNPKEAADIIFKKLAGKGILGRGNHFVDICGAYESAIPNTEQKYPHNIILVHTHGGNLDITIPATIAEAQKRQQYAEGFREYLGHQLATDIGSRSCEILGNWTHNSVEETEEGIIYRKGVVKVQQNKIHILPANIGEKIIFYTVSDEAPFKLPKYSSMPHATGRAGPRGKMKVSIDEIKKMRRQKWIPYIPSGISDTALRSEHPSCFNNFDRIFERLRYPASKHFTENYFLVTAEARILSYVGKV